MHYKKHLGQNFLIDPAFIAPILASAELSQADTVIEIGPGSGVLTEQLVKSAGKVFAIEKDFDLIQKLQKSDLSKVKNLKLVHQDALFFDLSTFSDYKVVANIPYNITSPLIRKFLEGENRPKLMVLMVQKEVAERITALPGSSERGLLTLIVEFFASAEIVQVVPKKAFYPVPKVDSAIIKINVKNELPQITPKLFFNVVKAGFSQKRRQIHNALSASLRLAKDETDRLLKEAQIGSQMRAEDLTFDDWLNLAATFNHFK